MSNNLNDIVVITVDAQSPGVTKAGFGVPLILSQNIGWTERTRSYTTLAGVLVDFAATTPEYNAAKQLFAQSPAPTKIRIGRANTNPVTQRWAGAVVAAGIVIGNAYKLDLTDPTGAPSKKTASFTLAAATAWANTTGYVPGNIVTNDTGKYYVCTAGGTSAGSGGPTGTGSSPITDGGVTWIYEASLGAAQNDAIVNGLVAAITALSGLPANTPSAQGAAGTQTLRVLLSATTGWLALDAQDPNLLNVLQDHAAPASSGIATDLTAIANETTDFYGVLSLYNSTAYVVAVAAQVETMTKLYVAAVADTTAATVVVGSGADGLEELLDGGYARTAGFFHPRASDFADCAEMGRFFPIDPGGDNWRLKTLSGVSSGWGNGQQYTSTQVTNIKDRNANFYYNLAGVDVIGGDGKVASSQYIDVERGIDWWSAELQAPLANLLIQTEKVPFTNDGFALVESIIRVQVKAGVTAGLINPGSPPGIPAPVVVMPTPGSISSTDRGNRLLSGVSVTWYLAGAVNKIAVTAHILV